jgi:phosphatidylglycerol:prolipoprotein diacylglycerol transferase
VVAWPVRTKPLVTRHTCPYLVFHVHKLAFEIAGLQVHWYGILVATGFLVGLWTASRRGVKSGFSPEVVMDLGTWILLGTIIGARAFYVVTYWKESFAGQPLTEIFMIQKGGVVFYGGLIGASIGCILYARRRKLPLWRFADVLAPSVPLGHFFGRFGCLMTGCCYGRKCDLPWAIHFPADHPTYPNGVHPTQIYEALLNLCLYFFLAWMFRRKKFDGQIFASYLIAYALLRSFVEVFRGDYQTHYILGWITPAHLVSIGILLGGGFLFWFLRRIKPAPTS